MRNLNGWRVEERGKSEGRAREERGKSEGRAREERSLAVLLRVQSYVHYVDSELQCK